MLQYTQLLPRLLWTVTQVGTVANERVAGISPVNPVQINPNFVGGVFHLRVITRTDISLGNVIVYGALHPVGGAAPYYFPAPGSGNAERLVTIGNNPAAVQGALRNPLISDNEVAPVRQIATVIPNALLLEYNTTVTGAAPIVTFEVWTTEIGPMMGGSQ